MSEPPTVSVGGTELQTLVDAHYATLSQILGDTIRKLEELQSCIPQKSQAEKQRLRRIYGGNPKSPADTSWLSSG